MLELNNELLGLQTEKNELIEKMNVMQSKMIKIDSVPSEEIQSMKAEITVVQQAFDELKQSVEVDKDG